MKINRSSVTVAIIAICAGILLVSSIGNRYESTDPNQCSLEVCLLRPGVKPTLTSGERIVAVAVKLPQGLSSEDQKAYEPLTVTLAATRDLTTDLVAAGVSGDMLETRLNEYFKGQADQHLLKELSARPIILLSKKD